MRGRVALRGHPREGRVLPPPRGRGPAEARVRRLRARAQEPAPFLRRAVPRPPAERRDDPRRDEARRGLDRRGPAPRRPRGHVPHEGAARRALRPGRRASRRRRHEDRQVRLHVEGGPAGRDVPQDAPRDDGRPQGHPRQARGPPAQHADPRAPARAQAARRRGRDDGDLRPAREPARDGQDEGRARGPLVPVPLPGGVRGAPGGRRRADEGLGRERREHPAGARREDRGDGDRGGDHGPRQAVLVDPAEAHPAGDPARAALRRPRVPHPRLGDPRVLHGPRHRPPGLAPGPGTHQGLHRDAEAELLPVPPHDARAGGSAAVRGPDPHARDGPHRGERHRGALEVQGGGGEPRARKLTSACSVRSSRPRRTSRTRASSSPR